MGAVASFYFFRDPPRFERTPRNLLRWRRELLLRRQALPVLDLAEQSRIHFRRRRDLPSRFSRRLPECTLNSSASDLCPGGNLSGIGILRPFSTGGTVPPDPRVVNDASGRPRRGTFGPCIDPRRPDPGRFGLSGEAGQRRLSAQGVEPGGRGSRAGIRPFGIDRMTARAIGAVPGRASRDGLGSWRSLRDLRWQRGSSRCHRTAFPRTTGGDASMPLIAVPTRPTPPTSMPDRMPSSVFRAIRSASGR